ncbi:PadR family transcriptional regulator [Photobacterium profundum]|uniref:Transcriptional regulator n=2 Tax=Photobacterium TaxID=657 RepID=Q1YZZ9_9GAMM|nr:MULTISPECIES: PadR family transcriptional regulator [Photobacterium]EAS41872.1 Putative transcriptional regulator [Photobacterium profundum 3TCK]PSV45743.1 PadR family transcriptional regulator [Photobacterium indicum]PSV61197.1 PadR family transcriptional regulator [Photobacterium profundum]
MSLPHVILTVLCSRDATGYDITKEFSHSIGYFWKASHQQVYRELNKMAGNDQVTCQLEPQDGKPDRKVYSITDLGRQALLEWFQEPARNPTIRDEFSAKLLVCGVHNSEPMQQQLEALIEESHTLMGHYAELEKIHFANHKEMDRQARLDRLTLRRGVHNRQAWIYWAEEVLAELKDMDSADSDVQIN